MAKITSLPFAQPLDGEEIMVVVQDGEARRSAVSDHIQNVTQAAQAARDGAVAFSNFVVGGLAAGEAATPVGQRFSVEHPAGTLSLRVRTVGGSTELAAMPTSARYAADQQRIGITPEQLGAVGDGIADDTQPMRASAMAALMLGVPWIVDNKYLVTGPIMDDDIDGTGGSFTFQFRRTAEITVSPLAAPFRTLFNMNIRHDNDEPHILFTGQTVKINCNMRCAEVFRFRRPDFVTGSTPRGTVLLQADVIIQNCRENGAAETEENAAFWVLGRWHMANPGPHLRVKHVSRVNATGGACSGFATDQGDPIVLFATGSSFEDIMHPPGGQDADGIKILSAFNTDYGTRPRGIAFIWGVTFRNCSGRAIKSQSIIDVANCKFFRGGPNCVAPMSETCDIDGQRGALPVTNCQFFHEPGPGGISPLGENHAWVVLQANNDYPDRQAISGLVCEGSFAHKFAVLIVRARAAAGDVDIVIEQIEARAVGALAGSSMFSQSVIQLNANEVALAALDPSPGKTNIRVRGVRVPTSVPIVGYNGLLGSDPDLAAKQTALNAHLRIDIDDCENTRTAQSPPAIDATGDQRISKPVFNTGSGLRALHMLYASGQTIDLRQLRAGTVFSVIDNAATLLPSEPPGFATGEAVLVEVKTSWIDVNYHWIDMTRIGATPTKWANHFSGAAGQWKKWEGVAA